MDNLISIVIPTFNSEKYIINCLESVKKQTYENFEVIIVDDGSTDATFIFCENFCKLDHRFHLYHKKNEGVSSARNYGIKRSIGQYIMFVDSDDYLKSDFLEIALKTCLKHKTDIFLSGLIYSCEEKYEYKNIEQTIVCRFEKLDEHIIIDLLKNNYLTCVTASLFQKGIIFDLDFNDTMNFGEDLSFMMCVMKRNPKLYISNECFYFYNLNNTSSLTHTVSLKRCYSTLMTYSLLYNFADSLDFPNKLLHKYIDERWIEDYTDLHHIILKSKSSIRYSLLKVLNSNKTLLLVIKTSNQKYLCRYAIHPLLSIIYYYYQKLRKVIK